MPPAQKPVYPGDRDAFAMLKRLVNRGRLANFNDGDAEKLIRDGLAALDGIELVPTDAGREAAAKFRIAPLWGEDST